MLEEDLKIVKECQDVGNLVENVTELLLPTPEKWGKLKSAQKKKINQREKDRETITPNYT